MKFTLNWLKAPLDTTADVGAIVEKLTAIGLEVEGVADPSAALKQFTVAKIVTAEKHPNADKLRLCMVETGDAASASSSEALGQQKLVQVVCGAPNARAGLKVVFARPGTVIPASGDVLKVGAIRGVESRGMLCSGRELLLTEDSEGIMELPEDAKVGATLPEILGASDPVIEVSITPNRGDCTSVYGIARDLAAAGLGRLREGDLSPVQGKFPSPIKTSVEGVESAAPIFAGRLVRNVKNGPSPQWLQDWLKAVGLRPISALVDVTNFISLDRGRPLHVFDADKLSGNLRARMAKDGEELLALDGRTYRLDSEMTVIADDRAALGIAGVIGGEESSVTDATTNVFIESAYFDPMRTAATGRKLGIVSDARYRFERGVDPEFVLPGLELATRMVMQFCGGEPSEIVVGGKVPEWKRQISFAPSKVKQLTGVEVPESEIAAILTRLGFAVEGKCTLSVTPPSWRSDVHGAADLVEEVVRIRGLDSVHSVPMERPDAIAKPVLTQGQLRTRRARRALAARGFNETVSFSFIPRANAKLFGGGDDSRQLENPIASDLDALRPSLLPSLLAAAQRNQARGTNELMLFEIGARFDSGMPGAQQMIAAGIRVGKPARHWSGAGNLPDVFAAKADMLAILESASGSAMNAPVKRGGAVWYHPGRSGTLALGPKLLAQFGEIHPAILKSFDIDGPVSAFEIVLDNIPDSKAKTARAAFAPSPYQSIDRDFAFVVDRKVAAEEIVRAIRNAERQLIESVSVFDIYEGKGIPDDKKSVAIAVRLQPRDKTLTDPEIEAVADKIVAAVMKATGATLRA